jgi:hypothetical protein
MRGQCGASVGPARARDGPIEFWNIFRLSTIFDWEHVASIAYVCLMLAIVCVVGTWKFARPRCWSMWCLETD